MRGASREVDPGIGGMKPLTGYFPALPVIAAIIVPVRQL